MIKFLITQIILLFIFQSVVAQKSSLKIGIGPSISTAVSNKNFDYFYKMGTGGVIDANYGITRLGSITCDIGGWVFGGKPTTTSSYKLTLIKFGYRSYFVNSPLFVEGNIGLSMSGSDLFAGRKDLILGISAGYSIKVSKNSSIDIFPTLNVIAGGPSNNIFLMGTVLYRFRVK